VHEAGDKNGEENSMWQPEPCHFMLSIQHIVGQLQIVEELSDTLTRYN